MQRALFFETTNYSLIVKKKKALKVLLTVSTYQDSD